MLMWVICSTGLWITVKVEGIGFWYRIGKGRHIGGEILLACSRPGGWGDVAFLLGFWGWILG